MHRIENNLKDLMLQSVNFVLDGKVIKSGKIKIYNTKHFFIRFKLDTDNGIKEFELPYPYKLNKTTTGYMFDYCLSAFIPETEEVFWKMKVINKEKPSKLHEKHLFISKIKD